MLQNAYESTVDISESIQLQILYHVAILNSIKHKVNISESIQLQILYHVAILNSIKHKVNIPQMSLVYETRKADIILK